MIERNVAYDHRDEIKANHCHRFSWMWMMLCFVDCKRMIDVFEHDNHDMWMDLIWMKKDDQSCNMSQMNHVYASKEELVQFLSCHDHRWISLLWWWDL